MAWSVGIDLSLAKSYDQRDLTLTVDGRPAEDALQQCGCTCVADIHEYITGSHKLPDEIHDECWGEGYVGPEDVPDMVRALSVYCGIPSRALYYPDAKSYATGIYGLLYWGRPGAYLRYGANGLGHWAVAARMDGGASADPFDTLTRLDPWGGLQVPETYAQFCASIMRYQGNAEFVLVTADRARSIKIDTRIGPQ